MSTHTPRLYQISANFWILWPTLGPISKLYTTTKRPQRFHRSAVATLDVPQEQKEEDKKMSLLLTDPQSQVFGDEEESDRCMQPLPSQITLKQ